MSTSRRVGTSTAALAVAALAVALPVSPAAASAGSSSSHGTFAFDATPEDTSLSRPSSGSCPFALRFFNFEAGQKATVTLTAKATNFSGKGEAGTVVLSSRSVVLSDDAALGKRDADAVVLYGAADLQLAGVTAHTPKGYRVTATVDVPGQKTSQVTQFWLQTCEPAAGSTGNDGDDSDGGGTGDTGDSEDDWGQPPADR